ncbi:MAG TPA: hypothetical protein PKE30_15890 [Niabella sp.]|nr:hypothetical protein [Niabella sp.]
MRNIVFILLMVVSFFACSKKSNVDNDIPKDIPAWLQVKVREIKKGDKPQLYMISEYRIKGEIYYNISLIYQSCMLCDVYDKKGSKANIVLDKDTNIELVRRIWPVIEE